MMKNTTTTTRSRLYLLFITVAIAASTIIASPAFASGLGSGGVTSG